MLRASAKLRITPLPPFMRAALIPRPFSAWFTSLRMAHKGRGVILPIASTATFV